MSGPGRVHGSWVTVARVQADADIGDETFAERWASLTKRQRAVLRARAEGLTVLQVAERLYVSEQTVKNTITQARMRLALPVEGNALAVRVAYLLGREDERKRWKRLVEARRAASGRKAEASRAG